MRVFHFLDPIFRLMRWFHTHFAGLIIIMATAVAGFVISFSVVYAWFALRPVVEDAPSQSFTVARGESMRVVAARLEAEGLMRSNEGFLILAWIQEKTGALKAGEFMLSPAMGPGEILRVLTDAAPSARDVNVTIPEGLTLAQIDARLSDAAVIKKDALVSGRGRVRAYTFLPACDEKRQEAGELYETCEVSFASLEGYLFPDTYRFTPQSEPIAVVEKLLNNFDKKLSLPFRADVALQDKRIHDVVIMASLLEREVRSNVDKALIAGILWKRFGQNYPLQVDATVLYALERAGGQKPKGVGPTFEDLQLDSPYNTYRYKGLPPGPISNPGLASIVAAIHFEASPYFFYLSASDGTTIFSKTLAEHNRAKARYLR